MVETDSDLKPSEAPLPGTCPEALRSSSPYVQHPEPSRSSTTATMVRGNARTGVGYLSSALLERGAPVPVSSRRISFPSSRVKPAQPARRHFRNPERASPEPASGVPAPCLALGILSHTSRAPASGCGDVCGFWHSRPFPGPSPLAGQSAGGLGLMDIAFYRPLRPTWGPEPGPFCNGWACVLRSVQRFPAASLSPKLT